MVKPPSIRRYVILRIIARYEAVVTILLGPLFGDDLSLGLLLCLLCLLPQRDVI